MTKLIREEVLIRAQPSEVWAALTEPQLMRQWMGEPEMVIAVDTTWNVGEPIIISGLHHARFRNEGTVLHYEPERRLTYTHLSSLSRLPAVPESFSTFDFVLTQAAAGTTLTLTIRGFPTESIFKHLAFYWRVTVKLLAELVEAGAQRQATTDGRSGRT